jgi:hypothetical protein
MGRTAASQAACVTPNQGRHLSQRRQEGLGDDCEGASGGERGRPVSVGSSTSMKFAPLTVQRQMMGMDISPRGQMLLVRSPGNAGSWDESASTL